ncbi:hypothetical protein NQ317_011384 [Molorchus minor]|uniref:Smr domain-containing protein n=1 Tax=Molorchus minor TaxID=1323400 RepID=A0ABQ9JR40_9CUCU|nr:hypothetical protein NQ317_011384 [Molorchus minor]
MATCTLEKRIEDNVVHKLNELFGSVLNLDVIKTVAVSCQYDVIQGKSEKMENSLTLITADTITTSITADTKPKKSRKAQDIERTINNIQLGYKLLVLVRGVPGCGKSYLARQILCKSLGFDSNFKEHILSTDDYFCKNGSYQYNPDKIHEAHGWNHNRAFIALSKGISPVIIDNTNVQMWEMKPYAMMATDYGYIIEILEPDTHWCFNEKELAKRNTHGVPRSKIKEMLERYEKNITSLKLLNAYNLKYRLQKPPQYRAYPPVNVSNSLSTNRVNINDSSDRYVSDGTNIVKSKSATVLNHQEFKSEIKPVETINLMEFNDDESANIKSQPEMLNNKITIKSWNTNPIDDILMCGIEPNQTSAVLQPSQHLSKAVITVDDSDEDNQIEHNKKFFPDLESAWGINETALRSWDIVTPVQEYRKIDSTVPQQSNSTPIVKSKESSSNTKEMDFQILRRSTTSSVSPFFKIIDTVNRDINRFTPKKERGIPKKIMIDKSCLTEDILEYYDIHINKLASLFPDVSRKGLDCAYKKFVGDLDLTIEYILESKNELYLLDDNTFPNNQTVDDKPIQVDSDSSNSDQTEASIEGRSKRLRKTSNGSNELKKIIESKIDISKEHYSKHLLKVKQYKFGTIINNMENSQQPASNLVAPENLLQPIERPTSWDIENNIAESDTSKSAYSKPSTSKSRSSVVDTDSDIDIDDYEVVDGIDKTERKPEETVELNLGEYFVEQLENKFGDPNIAYPKGFQPLVQVPVTLARQLYTFYIESVYQQMEAQEQVLDTLIKEDEEFARKLQAKENEAIPPQPETSTNLREIMDEQVAQNIYQKEVDAWKNLNPDNLAAILTKQKLFKVFPFIDKSTLVEILYAHDNKYEETVEILLASTGTENVGGNLESIREPPLKDEVIEEMKEAQNNSKSKEYEEQQEATFYREEASRYLKKREELYQKAQQYHQRGMTEVARFYSGLASQQTEYFDRANSMAAATFLDEHSKRLEDFNTIDLHFLYVKEAIPALDVFLDRNINLLRLGDTKNSECLQIITGRGRRSENGISKIRPAVMIRLKKRKIGFVQLNPGLLKVKVTKNSLVTSEL